MGDTSRERGWGLRGSPPSSHRWWPAYAPSHTPILLRGHQLSHSSFFPLSESERDPLLGEQGQGCCHPQWPALLRGKRGPWQWRRRRRDHQLATDLVGVVAGGYHAARSAVSIIPCRGAGNERTGGRGGVHPTAGVGRGGGAAVGLGWAGQRWRAGGWGGASPADDYGGRGRAPAASAAGDTLRRGGEETVATRRRRRRQFLRRRGASATAGGGMHVEPTAAGACMSGRVGGGETSGDKRAREGSDRSRNVR